MTTTTIKVHVSAADSIINACQCGWLRIQIDFSTWTQAEREYLATRVRDDEGASLDMSIAPPTAEQLKQWVTDQLAAIQRKRDDEKAQGLADIEAVEARLGELRALPTENLKSIHDVSPVTGYNTGRASTALRAIGIESLTRGGAVEPSQFGRGEDYASKIVADEARKQQAQAQQEATRAANEAEAEANLQAILSTVSPTLRAKFDAGFADRDDVEESYRASLLAEVGLPADTTGKEKLLTSLSDSEFQSLTEARKRFPDFQVAPYLVWDWDNESDVKVEERIVQVMVTRHGVTALGKIPLT